MLRRGRLRGARSFLATSRGDPRPSDLPIFRSRVSRKRAGRARGCPRCAAADARPREGSPRPPEAPSTRCSERGPLRPRGAIPDSARSPNARPKRVFFALVEADWPGRGPLGDAPQAAASGVVRQRGAPRGPRSDFEAGSRTHAPLPRPCRAHAPHQAAPRPMLRPGPVAPSWACRHGPGSPRIPGCGPPRRVREQRDMRSAAALPCRASLRYIPPVSVPRPAASSEALRGKWSAPNRSSRSFEEEATFRLHDPSCGNWRCSRIPLAWLAL